MQFKTKFFGTLYLVLASLLMVNMGWAAPKTLILKWADMSPSSGLRPQYLQKAAEEVEKATEGRVKIQFYWSNSLVNVTENVRSVQNRVADMAWTMPIYHPGEYPLGTMSQCVLTAPKGGDAAFIGKAFWEMWDESEDLRREVEQWGATMWYMFPYDAYGAYTKKPIKKLEDFDGQRLRVSSEGIGKMISAVGGIPEFIVASEVYTALEKNMFDGAIVGYEWGKRYSFYEVTKYLNLLDSCMIAAAYGIVSQKAVDRMSENDRKSFFEIGRRVSLEYAEAMKKSKQDDIQAMKESGMTLIPFPEEEKTKWQENPKVKEMIPNWLEEQKKAGREESGRRVMKIFLQKFQLSHLMPEKK